MLSRSLPERAVSTWSLHRTLGHFAGPDSAVGGGPYLAAPAVPPERTLLDLLPDIAAHGYRTLQICHFHLESREVDYLTQLRATMEIHDIALDMLLIDDGDLTAPDIERQLAWYDNWLDVAAALGARRARICAGRSQPSADVLEASGRSLALLARRHPEVRVVTENWLEATPDAASLLAVLDAAGDDVGLLIDLGNWHGAHKYDELAAIAAQAESCHAKCHFTAEGPQVDDFRQSLSILRDASFDGPMALIYDGPDDGEWLGLDREWEIVTAVWDVRDACQNAPAA